ncbi:hypothetical protein DV26_00615 [Amycolatopsis mediterranei]|uniref:Uncharacterized protein n=1 Tax=Amycolatopsis mediterranei (strain S699) TaxID=713604 RepID=A0A9R0P579_AMYMS|nr:hypothetical protein RAM_40115 [Amycolatopsis mediterranei S699]KDO12669.1 hypothetical protein DV26_00615 [Amycolatopsis mediterranei]KDU87582.1 hypothetical protein DV36_35305 [Amycolatopsis mediterranei]
MEAFSAVFAIWLPSPYSSNIEIRGCGDRPVDPDRLTKLNRPGFGRDSLPGSGDQAGQVAGAD